MLDLVHGLSHGLAAVRDVLVLGLDLSSDAIWPGEQLLSTEGSAEVIDLRLQFRAPLLTGQPEEARLTSQSSQADCSSVSFM